MEDLAVASLLVVMALVGGQLGAWQMVWWRPIFRHSPRGRDWLWRVLAGICFLIGAIWASNDAILRAWLAVWPMSGVAYAENWSIICAALGVPLLMALVLNVTIPVELLAIVGMAASFELSAVTLKSVGFVFMVFAGSLLVGYGTILLVHLLTAFGKRLFSVAEKRHVLFAGHAVTTLPLREHPMMVYAVASMPDEVESEKLPGAQMAIRSHYHGTFWGVAIESYVTVLHVVAAALASLVMGLLFTQAAMAVVMIDTPRNHLIAMAVAAGVGVILLGGRLGTGLNRVTILTRGQATLLAAASIAWLVWMGNQSIGVSLTGCLWGGLIATAQTNGWFNRLRAGRMLVWGLVLPVISVAIVAFWRVALRYQVFS